MKIWERQEGESDKAFGAFKIYLDLGNERTLVKVSEKYTKSIPLIKRWAREYDWKNRARAWDNELLAEKKRAYVRKFHEFLEKQFEGNEKTQARALKVLDQKDMSKISWRSWNEIYRANFAEMVALAEKLGAVDNDDNEIAINITVAEDSKDADKQGD